MKLAELELDVAAALDAVLLDVLPTLKILRQISVTLLMREPKQVRLMLSLTKLPLIRWQPTFWCVVWPMPVSLERRMTPLVWFGTTVESSLVSVPLHLLVLKLDPTTMRVLRVLGMFDVLTRSLIMGVEALRWPTLLLWH